MILWKIRHTNIKHLIKKREEKNEKVLNDVRYECEKLWVYQLKRWQQTPPQNASYTSHERSIDRLLNSS